MFRLYYICEQTIRKTEKGEKQYKCSLKNSLEELLMQKYKENPTCIAANGIYL